MNKQIAFAYGIAGLAVAAALVAVVATSTQAANDAADLTAPLIMTEPSLGATPVEQPLVVAQAAPTETLPPEYVYVDEPAPTSRRGHDDEHKGESHRERDDDRDDRGHDDDDD
jgi:hypothetical protein